MQVALAWIVLSLEVLGFHRICSAEVDMQHQSLEV